MIVKNDNWFKRLFWI